MNHASLDFQTLSPSELSKHLKAEGIHRFYFVYNPQTQHVESSHPLFEPLRQRLQADLIDYQEHEGLFFEVSQHYDMIYGACVHRSCRGQGQGGTRFWHYDRFIDFLYDGIRLSKGMTHKNALAGLWWGGGKGVISRPKDVDFKDPEIRQTLFEEYGLFMSSLRGCYITAEDVGTNTTDMGHIFSKTRFITCIPGSSGGSGNPSSATALGVIRGMEAGLSWLAKEGKVSLESESTPLKGKSIVVQGAGHVGEVMIDLMLEQGAHVYATDISAERVQSLQQKWSGQSVEVVLTDRNDLSCLRRECDVLCPAATGAILNQKTIPSLKTTLICGAANNQLEDPQRDGEALLERGIVYLPDFLVNRMGIVNCANEQYGYVDHDPSFMRHFDREWESSIFQVTQQVLERSKTEGIHPHHAAVDLADELSKEPHPIWGHRGQKIINALVKSNWVNR